jgi:protein ImuB
MPSTLWLALQFPHLSLDLVTRSHDLCSDLPVAIADNDARRQSVLDCNPAAAHAGIRPGMPVNAALGLLETLHLVNHDATAEHDALQRLAAWCYQYSSQVTIMAGRATLLLEAGASRRLFGAAEDLSQKLCSELQQLGYHLRAGTGPTPGAARLAARHGLHIARMADIPAQIRALPLENLELDTRQSPALQKMGFRTVGEVLRLPRKALARRMGPAAVDYLDRLTGARPDPQTPWRPPERFSSGMDLLSEVRSSQALLFPLKRLVHELCGVLRARDLGIQQLHIELQLDAPSGAHGPERLRLGMQQPTRDAERILLLLRERLERLRLRRPVRHIRLHVEKMLAFDASQDSLFRDDPDLATQPVRPLLERLQARLGEGAVRGLKGVQDHRPEHSWSVRELDEPADCTAMPHRPVWLFARPQRCRIDDYQVLAGPERIEAGWWDGHDCRRDYFVVRDRSGSTLWAFREYKPEPGWYLQGMFS